MTELVDSWLHYQGRLIYGRTSRSGAHPDRPAILLVHGRVVSGRYLLPLADALAGSFDVHVPDLPGFGRSPGPKAELQLVDLADAIIGWMDAAHIPDAVLVANSFGCQIALEAAVRHPDRVTMLVLQGPSTDARARSAIAQLKRFARNAVHESPSLFPLMMLDYLKTAKGRVLRTFRTAVKDPIEDKLKNIGARTLIIGCERDPISPPDWCRRIALEMPNAEHVEVEGASHTLVYNQPRLMARIVRHFVLGDRFRGPATERVLGADPRLPEFVADFDSSTAMLRATARGLDEEAFENLGLSDATATMKRVLRAARWSIGVRPWRIDTVKVDRFQRWVVDSLPPRTHPAMFIGSSNGAVVHLATAMGAPWLPQTFLLPVRHYARRVPDLVAEMEWGRRTAAPLLAANPDISLVHVHDPHRNHLAPGGTSYFRLKLRELGTTYRTFIHRYLDRGGTIYVVDCTKRWPQVKLSDRHSFQPGALGGLAPEQLLEQRVRAPDPDAIGPEAEWGFEPAILEDVLDLAERRGYRVVRLSYDDPDDLSPVAADAISEWYREMGVFDHHLLVGNSVLMDPWWAIRTGSVPFWTSLDRESSVNRVLHYLSESDRWRSVDLMLLSQAATDLDRWQEVIRRAGTGALLGIDASDDPEDRRDLGMIARYSRALRQQVARRKWPLHPLEVGRLDRHLAGGNLLQMEELIVSQHNERSPVTLRVATGGPISLPTW